MLGGEAEGEDIVSSGSEDGKDYVRGFAQRATDPYVKERKAKGAFVVSSTQGRSAWSHLIAWPPGKQ